MEYQLKVREGIAPFYLGESIDSYLNVYEYEFSEGEEEDMCDDYLFFNSEICVFVDKETRTIDSIRCGRYCYLHNQDIIGMPIKSFLDKKMIDDSFEVERIYMPDDKIDNVYDFDCGVQIWVNQLDTIETVFVM